MANTLTRLALALIATALAGCGESDPAFTVSGVHTVSAEESPFADCSADLEEGLDWHEGHVQPWVAVDPNDPQRIAVVYARDVYDEGDQNQDNRGVIVAVSRDGGATWDSAVVPGITRCAGGDWHQVRYGWVTAGANGDLYVMAEATMGWAGSASSAPTVAQLVSRSTDWGETWGTPVEVVVVDEDEPGLPNYGSLLAHPTEPCTLYATYTRYRGLGSSGHVELARSTDCGATWDEPRAVSVDQSPSPWAGQLRILGDGTLVMLTERPLGGASRAALVQRSEDGGSTWSSPTEIATAYREAIEMPDPSQPTTGLLTGPIDVAHDPRTDRLYGVWEDRMMGDRVAGVAFTESTDGGLTWSTPIRIDAVPEHSDPLMEQAFLPSVAVASDGTVGVLYLSFENDVAGDPWSHADAWLTTCRPDGRRCTRPAAWSESPLRLTPASFDMRTAPYSDPATYGFYIAYHLGLEGVGDGFAAALPIPDEFGGQVQVVTVAPD